MISTTYVKGLIMIFAWLWSQPVGAVINSSVDSTVPSERVNRVSVEMVSERVDPNQDISFSPDRLLVIERATGAVLAGENIPITATRYSEEDLKIHIQPEASGSAPGVRTEPNAPREPVTTGQLVSALLTLTVHPAQIIEILRHCIQSGH